jgi:transcriptional regulator with XRE-family HTH domain
MTTRPNDSYREDLNLKGADRQQFAKRVRYLIGEAGSSVLLAARCGVSPSIVRKWKEGMSDPTRVNLIALASAAQVSLEWLISGEGRMSAPRRLDDEAPADERWVPKDDALRARMETIVAQCGGLEALESRADIHRYIIGDYLTGRLDPSRHALVRLSTAAGVRIEWLATGEGPMRASSPMEELLTAAERELGRPIDMKEAPRELLVAAIRAWWNQASEKERVWLEVQLERSVPELMAVWAELKKNPGSSSEKTQVG